MRHRVIIPVLFAALVGVGVWGYSQYQTKRQWEISAENQYQRAFEELATNVNNLEADMSKSLVAASFPQTIQLLTNIWRAANSCQEDLGQLPLTSMELAETKNLLANVSAFCFNTTQEKLVKGQKLGDSEWNRLKAFRNRAKVLAQHLGDMQQDFFNSRARWLEVDRTGRAMGATGMAENFNNNKVTKSFLMLEDGLKRVPDMEYEGNNLDFTPKPTGLVGKNVSIKEAEEICRRFLATHHPNTKVKYERTIRGGFPSYMIKATTAKGPIKELRCSVSVKGGHVAWVLGDRPVASAKLSLDQCAKTAADFLNQKGYPGMQVVAKESFENIATLTCAPKRNNVLYYPELVKVQVAQDNGDILGCDFVPYLTFNDPTRKNPSPPARSPEQIRQGLNKYLKLKRIQMAEVLDEMYNKVLCYEVEGTQGNDRFLIYYNANTGKEEKIRRIDQDGNEIT
ncbi:MAG TPA: germination protein YpeB [Bacillota bacterium]